MKKALLITVALALMTAPALANLVADSSFESGVFGNGIGSWSQWKNLNSAFSTTYALSGTNSLNIFGSGEHGVFQTIAVLVGTQYKLSVNAMGDQTYVGWKFGSGGTQWEFAPVNKDYDEFKYQEWFFTPTAATVTIYLDSETGAFPSYWDDVALVAVPEPGSVLALLTGVAGLAGMAFRRRK